MKFIRAITFAAAAMCVALPAQAESKNRTPGALEKNTSGKGGYSYSYADTVNTYGDSRTKFGGASVYRDRSLDRQTTAGPFDQGYFFDSGVGLHGGDSPYLR